MMQVSPPESVSSSGSAGVQSVGAPPAGAPAGDEGPRKPPAGWVPSGLPRGGGGETTVPPKIAHTNVFLGMMENVVLLLLSLDLTKCVLCCRLSRRFWNDELETRDCMEQ